MNSEQALKDLRLFLDHNEKYRNITYFCGGMVRDEIIDKNINPKDLDIVVDAHNGGIDFAIDMCKFYNVYKEDSNPVCYNRFKTAKFVINGNEFESISPRLEIYKKDTRNPDVRSCSIYEDTFRRDLTINALYKNAYTGEILDYCCGINDIKSKILTTPIDPTKTFYDDPLRMLRVFRFAAKYTDFTIDENVLASIKQCHQRIRIISAERISDEIIKMFSVKDSHHLAKILDMMMNSGLLNEIFPGIKTLKKMPQGIVHSHRNVWTHTLNAIKNTNTDYKLRLAVLLHDIGKKDTMQYFDKDKITYPLHHIKGYEQTVEILKKLKFCNKDINLISNAVKMHMTLNEIYFKHNNLSIRNIESCIAIKNIIFACVDIDLCFNTFKADVQSLDLDKRDISDDCLEETYRLIKYFISRDDYMKSHKKYYTGDEIIKQCADEIKQPSDIKTLMKKYNDCLFYAYF